MRFEYIKLLGKFLSPSSNVITALILTGFVPGSIVNLGDGMAEFDADQA
jgi:hypothetical protein